MQGLFSSRDPVDVVDDLADVLAMAAPGPTSRVRSEDHVVEIEEWMICRNRLLLEDVEPRSRNIPC